MELEFPYCQLIVLFYLSSQIDDGKDVDDSICN